MVHIGIHCTVMYKNLKREREKNHILLIYKENSVLLILSNIRESSKIKLGGQSLPEIA